MVVGDVTSSGIGNPNPTQLDIENVVATTKNNGTLPINDNSGRTQLDIEPSDHDQDGDEDLPPLTTYLSGWKFWCKFAIWPFVFFTLNGVVVTTLLVFDEHEFQNGKRSHISRSYNINDDFAFGNNMGRNQNIQFEMTKYNRMVMAILLLVDALVLYGSAKFLERKVRELDMIGDDNDDDLLNPSSPTSNGIKPNVYAQVSRKLDNVLGRSPQSRVSILVSILWLLFVGCGTVGLVSLTDWVFAMSPKGKKVCTKLERKNDFSSDDTFNRTKPDKIDNIPDELLEWAVRRDWYMNTGTGSLVHLSNDMTYFSASDPRRNDTQMDEFTSMYGEMRQLVSIGSDGQIQFYKNVLEPSNFISVSGESPLNSTYFCCTYTNPPPSNKGGFDMFFYGLDTSLLCVQSSETIVDGVFNNVTLNHVERNTDRSDNNQNFAGISLKKYDNDLWVKVIFEKYDPWGGNFQTLMKYYKVTPSNTLELHSMAEKAFSGSSFDNSGFEEPFLIGPGSPCYKWTRNIDVFVFLFVLGTASVWMMAIKNLSVGIVPICAAGCIVVTRINHELGLALCSITAIVAFLGLLGVIPIPLSRERLTWGMYTLLFWIGGLIFTGRFYVYYGSLYNFERALVTITIMSLIGFILNHPVLYLFGWIGGIWAIFCGIFLIFTPQHHQGWFAIGLGIIMGSGCATVGLNLIQYRAHVVYYSKRAWIAMNGAMQNNNQNHRTNSHRANTTNGAGYTPVLRVPQDSPIRSAAPPGRGENDITSLLLNQNSEGRGN